jgi:NADPH:quinone reductase-like Zn-dependent oxidoreductase
MGTPRFVEIGSGRPPLSLAGRETVLLVLSGALGDAVSRLGPGDAVVGPPAELAPLASGGTARLLVEERSEGGGEAPRRIGRSELAGTGIPGITGLRILHRTAGGSLLRLGPPPGARWLVTGLRAVAVFTGRLLLFEGAAPREVPAGGWLVAEDPSRALPVQAGNDSALALAFAAPDVRVVLG